MKILFMNWNSFGNEDILEAFRQLQHETVLFPFSNKEGRRDPVMEQRIAKAITADSPDAVFSFNYFPIVSNVCKKADIPYISWIYDSPYVLLYSYTAINPCNYIFVFDKELCLEFNRAGIQTVHYLPMAANTDRLSRMAAKMRQSNDLMARYSSEISFVGSLYHEKHNFFDRMTGLSDFAKGYLDGLMAAQMKVYGYNFIQDSLGPVMDELYKALPMNPNADGVESREYLYAQYVLNRKITGLEREHLLGKILQDTPYRLDLYTHDTSYVPPIINTVPKKPSSSVFMKDADCQNAANVYSASASFTKGTDCQSVAADTAPAKNPLSRFRNLGQVDYYDTMPYIFYGSKINLNISLRSIKSGIPLRAFDIMGCGGFLLTNYQSDFLDDFIPGEDFVYYDSDKDMIRKITYYLSHEEERQAIASRGFQKVQNRHTFLHRIPEMLSYL